MISVNCYNFLFHPLSDAHPTTTKILAVITNIALTALTFGVYLLALAGVHWMEQREVAVVSDPFAGTTDLKLAGVHWMEPRDVVVVSDPFVGTIALKKKLTYHLSKLEQLATQGQWKHIASHTNHPDSAFDWWMFPSDKPSRGQGHLYTVTKTDIARLKEDKEFMTAYKRGVELVLLAWGWDMQHSEPAQHPHPDQHWTGYKIRLEKIVYSLNLFGMTPSLCLVNKFIQAHHIALADWATH